MKSPRNLADRKFWEIKVGFITFYMSLSVNYLDLKPYMTELTHLIAQELDVNFSEVHLMNLSTKGNDSLVKWAIYPAGSANYMTNAAAMEIIHRLAESRVHLPDTFGSYKLFEWGIEPPPKRTGWPQSYLIVVIALSVVLILGLSAFLGWLIWRRGQESSLPYERVESVETVVREQELQPLK